MLKQKQELTAKQESEKARLRKEYAWIFVGGKQKRVRRPPMIDGMDVDEFIRRNADPIWLHREGLWEYLMLEDEDTDKAEGEVLPL
jgi:hypothetical protein